MQLTRHLSCPEYMKNHILVNTPKLVWCGYVDKAKGKSNEKRIVAVTLLRFYLLKKGLMSRLTVRDSLR